MSDKNDYIKIAYEQTKDMLIGETDPISVIDNFLNWVILNLEKRFSDCKINNQDYFKIKNKLIRFYNEQ